jgi:hypothetical protein
MTANTSPIYTLTPDVSSNNGSTVGGSFGTAAANDFTGVSANYVLEHTAGANGSYVEKLRFKPLGTNIAGVARIFLNNGSTPGTAANNTFFGEVSLPATTSSTSSPTGPDVDYVMNIRLPAGWRIYVGSPAALASGWNCVAVAGQY